MAIVFDRPCGKRPLVRDLTTDAKGERPLFITQVERYDGVCTWEVATAFEGKAAPIAFSGDSLDRKTVAQAPDGSIWATVNRGYVDLPAGSNQYESGNFYTPVHPGLTPASIGITKAGEVIAIERRGWSEALPERDFVVDVTARTSTDFAEPGYAGNLQRGSDGMLYVDYLASNFRHGCRAIRIGGPRLLRDAGSCSGVTDAPIAVGRNGRLWLPSRFGVRYATEPRSKGYFGPVYPTNCGPIGNSSWMFPRLIVADQRDNVWFVFRKLWHVDPAGKLSSIDLPLRTSEPAEFGDPITGERGRLVLTSDGTLWLSNGWSLYQFIPSP